MGRLRSLFFFCMTFLLALTLGMAVGFMAGRFSRPAGKGKTAQPLAPLFPEATAWLEQQLLGHEKEEEEEEEERKPQMRITGIVDIQPELRKRLKPTDTLFLIVTLVGDTVPLAVKRVQPVELPLIYTVGPEDQMIVDKPFEGLVTVKARVDRDGQANSPKPDDMTGQSAGTYSIPARGVHILIDTLVTGKKG